MSGERTSRTGPERRSVRAELWGEGRRALTIGIVLNVAATAFEALAVATVLPTVVAQVGGIDLYGWAFSAFMLTNLIGIVAGGAAADERGPAAPFLAGAVAFATGLVVAGAAPSMTVLVVGRAVQGIGGGAIAAIGYAVVGRAYTPAARPRMLAILSTAWVVPGLVGPAIAGLIADAVGWRWVFFGIAPLALCGAALAMAPLRALAATADSAAPAEAAGSAAPTGAAPGPLRRSLAAVALACGAGLFLAGLDRGADAAAATAVAIGLASALPPMRSLLPPGTLALRSGAPAAVALIAMLGFAFFGAEAFLPLALSDVRGQSAAFVGLPLTAGTIAWTAGAWIQAREAHRRSRRGLIAAGLALLAAGIAIVAAVLLPGTPLALAAIGWGLAGLGMGLAYSTDTLVILESAPAERAGETSAALQLAITLGIAIGTGLGGAIVGAASDAGHPMAAAIALVYAMTLAALGVAGVAAIRLPRRHDGAAPAVTARAPVKPSPSDP